MTEPGPFCVFCAILAGRLPSSRVHEDADTVAFLDIRPLTPGHLLVIPRAHAAGLAELDEGLGARVFTVAQRLAAGLRQSGFCAGTDLFLADGVTAGQEVFHVHLHVIPRYPGDGFRLKARVRTPDRGTLDATAGEIRQALGTSPAGPDDPARPRGPARDKAEQG
jgi:diadenosine tetraphosphate (Ap4A) HIT family hydrolase